MKFSGSKKQAKPFAVEQHDTGGQGTDAEKHQYKHKDVNHGEKSFAAGLSFYKLVWVFVIGSVLGTLYESILRTLQSGTLQYAVGLLYGPFSQVYGIGALVMGVSLYRIRHKNFMVVFLCGTVLGLVVEYVCSWVQQVVFGSKSWDYSALPFNIGGRTNLLYGFGWGIMGLIFIKHVWPFLSEYIERIPNRIGRPLTRILAVFMAVNMLLSAAAVWRWESRDRGASAQNAAEQVLDRLYPDSFMKKRYFNMQFVNTQPDK